MPSRAIARFGCVLSTALTIVKSNPTTSTIFISFPISTSSTEPEDADYGGPQPNRNVMSLGDRLQRLQREQRRKAALYETASSGTDTNSSGNSSNADDANDIGQALVDEAKNSEDITEKDVNFGRLLNGNHRHRKYDRA